MKQNLITDSPLPWPLPHWIGQEAKLTEAELCFREQNLKSTLCVSSYTCKTNCQHKWFTTILTAMPPFSKPFEKLTIYVLWYLCCNDNKPVWFQHFIRINQKCQVIIRHSFCDSRGFKNYTVYGRTLIGLQVPLSFCASSLDALRGFDHVDIWLCIVPYTLGQIGKDCMSTTQ